MYHCRTDTICELRCTDRHAFPETVQEVLNSITGCPNRALTACSVLRESLPVECLRKPELPINSIGAPTSRFDWPTEYPVSSLGRMLLGTVPSSVCIVGKYHLVYQTKVQDRTSVSLRINDARKALFYMPVGYCSYIVYTILAPAFLHTETPACQSLMTYRLRSRLLRLRAIPSDVLN